MDPVWNEWLKEVMLSRPKNSPLLDCKRGMEIGRLALDLERNNFNWRRSDVDTFWLDVQLCVKYKLSDDECLFIFELEPGVTNYKTHAKEKNAYNEMKRGLKKLRIINSDRMEIMTRRDEDGTKDSIG